jgi:GTP-binding protein HflX
LISDTVGFIRKLPSHLVAAFRATLEELEGANLLLQVADAANPKRDQQAAAVDAQIETMGLSLTPRIRVWNKIDLLEPEDLKRLHAHLGTQAVTLSAQTGEGLQQLLDNIDGCLDSDPVSEVRFELPASEQHQLGVLHRYGEVLSTDFSDGGVVVRARVPQSLRRRLQAYAKQAGQAG